MVLGSPIFGPRAPVQPDEPSHMVLPVQILAQLLPQQLAKSPPPPLPCHIEFWGQYTMANIFALSMNPVSPLIKGSYIVHCGGCNNIANNSQLFNFKFNVDIPVYLCRLQQDIGLAPHKKSAIAYVTSQIDAWRSPPGPVNYLPDLAGCLPGRADYHDPRQSVIYLVIEGQISIQSFDFLILNTESLVFHSLAPILAIRRRVCIALFTSERMDLKPSSSEAV